MQKKLSILSLSLVLAFAANVNARVINPLIAPKPAGTEQAQGAPSAQASGGAGPSGVAGNQSRGNMPQGMPPPPVPYSANGGESGVKKKEEFSLPSELAGLDDKWFVSAITGTSAILRLRDASLGVTASVGSGQGNNQPPGMMSPGMAGMQSAGGSSAPSSPGSGVIQRSLLVSNGKPLEFKGYLLKVNVNEGVVHLSYSHEGRNINVFQSGVDVFAIRRTPQTTKETPAANLPSLMKAGATTGAQTNQQTGGTTPGMTGQTF